MKGSKPDVSGRLHSKFTGVVMVEQFPPLVRDAVLADVAFAANLSLTSDATVMFKPASVSFRRSVLFSAVREASRQPEPSTSVTDEVGQTWTLKFKRDQAPVNLSVSSGSVKFFVSHLGVLSEISDERVQMLDSAADRVSGNLTGSDYDRWASLASQRPFTDDEVTAFGEDLNDTPAAVVDLISGSISANKGSLPLDVSFLGQVGITRDWSVALGNNTRLSNTPARCS